MKLFVGLLVAVCIAFSMANDIIVKYTGGHSCNLTFQDTTFPCSLGKNGVSADKKEGDGCTPLGSFPLRRIFYRKDKIEPPKFPAFIQAQPTHPRDGWCDEPTNEMYNKYVQSPFPASHENLWLNGSNVYDMLAVVGYNDDPIVPYKGSAIFFHVTETYGGTAGCIALKIDDLKWVLSRLDESTLMNIQV